MKRLLLPLLFVACAASAGNPFDEADNRAMSREQRKVRDLFVKAAESEADPQRRDEARIRAARIDWYVFHDPASARTRLAAVDSAGIHVSRAHAERSRLETELAHDFAAARKAAQSALETAATQPDRDEALVRFAAAAVEEARLQRDAGKCPDKAPLTDAIAKLRQAIAGSGPGVESSRLMLDAALLANDDDAALAAWRGYYTDLPSLVPAAIADRRSFALALASSRLYPQADLVLRDPCAETKIASDPEVRDIVAYAAALRRVTAIAAEHHRATGAGTADDKAFRGALMSEGQKLWSSLSWPGAPPAFKEDALPTELRKRFGAVITLGQVEGIFNLLYGHVVADEVRTVEQYGRRGSLRFIQVDGMAAGGYAAAITHNATGTGGWIGEDAMYQVRPMYVDGPLNLWRRSTDPVARKRFEDEVKRESALDRNRVSGDAIAAVPGLTMRLRQQYVDALRARLEAEGLKGDALRAAFVRTASADKLASSIWAHEGRHSIDKAAGISKNEELEFRAKLSEVAFAPAPRASMGSILSPIGGSGAHGKANERVLRGVVAWMKSHAAEIAGFDASAPLLTQLDRLTDEQLRAAFRSVDPLAKGKE